MGFNNQWKVAGKIFWQTSSCTDQPLGQATFWDIARFLNEGQDHFKCWWKYFRASMNSGPFGLVQGTERSGGHGEISSCRIWIGIAICPKERRGKCYLPRPSVVPENCILPFFLWSAPVAFRRVALETPEWTSRDSNHHRQSVSAGKSNAIPTEPSGRLRKLYFTAWSQCFYHFSGISIWMVLIASPVQILSDHLIIQ